MNLSTRFTVALHVLTLLATNPGQEMTSEYIAGSVNTNPVVVRRLLASLRQLGMVRSQSGAKGGWLLAADPARLTLRQVRQAVHEGSPFSMHSAQPNPLCPVGRNIQGALGPIYQQAELAMEEQLGQTTIQNLLETVLGQ